MVRSEHNLKIIYVKDKTFFQLIWVVRVTRIVDNFENEMKPSGNENSFQDTWLA